MFFRTPVPVLSARRGRVRDASMLAGWIVRSAVHSATLATPWPRRLWSWWRVLVFLVLWPVSWLMFAVMLCPVSPWTFYFDADRTACFSVRTCGRTLDRTTWTVANHMSARPGHGHGRRLRDQHQDTLYAQADALGIPILFTAAHRRLAEHYAATHPQLERRAAAHLPGQVPMIRRPSTPR